MSEYAPPESGPRWVAVKGLSETYVGYPPGFPRPPTSAHPQYGRYINSAVKQEELEQFDGPLPSSSTSTPQGQGQQRRQEEYAWGGYGFDADRDEPAYRPHDAEGDEPHFWDDAEGDIAAPVTVGDASHGSMFAKARNVHISGGTFVSFVHPESSQARDTVVPYACFGLLAYQTLRSSLWPPPGAGAAIEATPPPYAISEIHSAYSIAYQDLPILFTPLLFLYIWRFLFHANST